MERLIFGIDAGTASVGAAAILYDSKKNEGKIIRLISRIFPETRESSKDNFVPKNQKRRISRQMRRQYRRRKTLRKDINELLAEYSFLPNYKSEEWEQLMKVDPVPIRARAISERVKRYEFGRAISHLSKKRQFKGKDKFEAAIEEADEVVADEFDESTKDVTNALTARKITLGQYLNEINDGRSSFAKQNPSKSFQRPLSRKGFRTDRTHIEFEYDKIIEEQIKHYPELGKLAPILKQVLFFQRPVFWRTNTLGHCRLMGDHYTPAPKGEWLSAQRRMLEKLNNLMLITETGEEPLSQKMRNDILAELQVSNSLNWAAVRKAAGLPKQKNSFNLEKNKTEKSLLGNPIERQLKEIFSEDWETHPHKQHIRDSIFSVIGGQDVGRIGQRIILKSSEERKRDRTKSATLFGKEIGASPSQIDAMVEMTFPAAWDAYSIEALKKLYPELEGGVKMGTLLSSQEYEDWRNSNFPDRDSELEVGRQRLPSPAEASEQKRLSNLRNPSVVRTQNQIRKVVNNLIEYYGRKPDIIRIELARDLQMGSQDRLDYEFTISKNNKARKKAAEELKSKGIREPKHRDIEKYLLWMECEQRDPYQGKAISFDALFRNGEFEVEHIWPRARSLDDSFTNKTIAARNFNSIKGNRLPFEYFETTYGEQSDEWEFFVKRVTKLFEQKRISKSKLNHFLAKDIPERFASRQLNDTRYASKQAVEMLNQLAPPNDDKIYVQPINQRIVGQLRHYWGLSKALGSDVKSRDDHRHHAIDALVVALAEPKTVNQLASYWAIKDDYELATGKELNKPKFPQPWPTIVAEATEKASKIMVSHVSSKKINGALHDQQPLRNTGREVKNSGKTYTQFSIRTDVKSITEAPKFKKISNDDIRKKMEQLLSEANNKPKDIQWNPTANDPDSNFYYLEDKSGVKKTPVTHVRVVQQYQSKLVAKTNQGYMPMGNSHHIAVFINEKGKAEYDWISRFVAMKRHGAKQPVVQRTKENCRFLASLSLYDTIKILSGDKAGYWIVFGIPESGQLTIYRPNDAARTVKNTITIGALVSAGFQKLSVDPIGRIRYAND